MTVKRAKAAAIGHLVDDKVHAPNIVARRRRPSLLAMHRGRMAPRSFPPQGQSFLGVHAIEALFADVPALAPHQHQEPAIAEAHPRLRQLAHPLAQGAERIAPALVPQTRPPEARRPTGASLADAIPAHQVAHHLALLHGLQNFF
jgi:hypothetical protein